MNKKSKKPQKKDSMREFIDQCAKNAQARRANPKYQDAWRKQYAESLRTGQQMPNTTPVSSCSGVAAPKSIFELEWKRHADPELAERERLALEEARAKARCVGPAYNKGGLQLITKTNDEF